MPKTKRLRPNPLADLLRAADWRFCLFAAFAVGLRIAFALEVEAPVQHRAADYLEAARSLGAARVAPLYPILLGLLGKVFGFGPVLYTALNTALDVASLFLLRALGRRISGRFAAFGLLLAAISSIWSGGVNLPLPESLATLLLLAFVERWTRPSRGELDVIFAGVFLGLLALCEPACILFAPAILAAEAIGGGESPKGARLSRAAAVPFLIWSFFLPACWSATNVARFGSLSITPGEEGRVSAWTAMHSPYIDWRIGEHVAAVKDHPWYEVISGGASPERRAQVIPQMSAELSQARHSPFSYLADLRIPAKEAWLWVLGWWNPFPDTYLPVFLGSTYLAIFCLPILILGLPGLVAAWRDPGEAPEPVAAWRATRTMAALIVSVSLASIPFLADCRDTLPAYVLLTLWCGPGLALLTFTRERA